MKKQQISKKNDKNRGTAPGDSNMTRIVVVEVYHVCAAAKRNKNIEKRKEKT